MLRIPLLSISLMLFSVTASAQATTQWVTDQLEVTLRSGPSTSNKILRIMNSGETVTLIEADDETKYSLVYEGCVKQEEKYILLTCTLIHRGIWFC